MDKDWFLQAHESHDLYAAELFEALQTEYPNANFISANYSRLVTDLNAMGDASILTSSSEYSDIKIIGNMNLSEREMAQRIKAIHWPYHDAVADLIDETRAKHGGVIKLDIHSFSPTWQGCPMSRCDVGISTIRCEKTPFSEAFEDFLRKEDAPYHFVSGKPYKVAERPNNVAHDIQSRNKVQYLGVEIRSDLIDTPKKRTDMARYIGEGINHVLSQPNIQEIMAPWESKSKPRVPESDIVQIWM